MCSPASAILAGIVTILVSFEAILKRISVNINFRSQFHGNVPTIVFTIDQNCFKTYKYSNNNERILHLQVNTFFKYWLNTRKYYHNTYKYCHNTCEYLAGEYTLILLDIKYKLQ